MSRYESLCLSVFLCVGLSRYIRHGWPTDPPPEAPDRSRDYNAALQRGDEQRARHIAAVAQAERRALRRYKARQQAAMQVCVIKYYLCC